MTTLSFVGEVVNTPAHAHHNTLRRLWDWLPLGWVRHIRRDNGSPYLDRYTVLPQGASGNNPWRLYLHHFQAPDNVGHHNHPSWWSLSIVLWGSYEEEMLEIDPYAPPLFALGRWDSSEIWTTPLARRLRTRRVRWFNWIRADKYHRITRLHPGPGAKGVWTLFMCGPLARNPDGTSKGWGFWVPGRGHVPWAVLDAEKRDAKPESATL